MVEDIAGRENTCKGGQVGAWLACSSSRGGRAAATVREEGNAGEVAGGQGMRGFGFYSRTDGKLLGKGGSCRVLACKNSDLHFLRVTLWACSVEGQLKRSGQKQATTQEAAAASSKAAVTQTRMRRCRG